MSPQAIKAALEKKPFEAFTIHTGDGSTVDVLSSEFVWLRPGGRTLEVDVPRVVHAKDDADFENHSIDVFLITKLTKPPRRRNGTARRAG